MDFFYFESISVNGFFEYSMLICQKGPLNYYTCETVDEKHIREFYILH